MLTNITWTQFLIVLGSITIIYYIAYFIRFYGRDFLEKLNKDSTDFEEDQFSGEKTANEHHEEDQLSKLETLVNEIKSGVLVKAGKTATKEQLLQAIAEKVANYDGLHQPAYRYALNNFIIQHSKVLCGVAIEEEELEELWNKLPR